jgi:phage shock protein C
MTPRKIEKKDETRRLFKSRRDRILDGVCGGVAEYLDVPPAVVRIAWLLLLFVNGLGVVLYIASMILVPVNPEHKSLPREDRPRPSFELVGGLLLIFFGFCVLMNWASELWDWDFPSLMPWGWWHPFPWRFVFPSLLILTGAALIARTPRSRTEAGEETPSRTGRKDAGRPRGALTRSDREKVIGGVCGGIGLHYHIDPTVVRILYSLITIGTGLSFGVVLYIAMMIVLPKNGNSNR